MNKHEKRVIKSQIDLLWHLREKYENDLTINQVSWIDDDITYVEVKCLNIPIDCTRGEEFRENAPKRIDFLNALSLLSVRIENTAMYLGIKD